MVEGESIRVTAMSDPSATPATEPLTAPDTRARLSPLTTPTWEIELLLSGALVYALLHLPAELEYGVQRLVPVVSEGLREALVLISVYLRAGLIALATAFVLHLGLRAYWVALVGVHSVYPLGPRFERMRQGPLTMERLRSQWRPLPEHIERFDNASSIVFATGVSLGLLMLGLAITVGLIMLAAAVLGHFSPFGLNHHHGLIIFGVLALGPMTLAATGDALLRHAPQRTQGRLGRWLRAGIATQRWFPGVESASVLLNSVMTNLVRRGSLMLGMMIMTMALLGAALSMPRVWEQLPFRILAPAAGGEINARPTHYRNQRSGLLQLQATPTIASLELGDQPLRLFYPLRRDRDPAWVRSACSSVGPTPGSRATPEARTTHTRALLDCLHALVAPTLDGQPLPAHERLLMVDPHSGLEGVLWRIPNAAIAEGRHVLALQTRPAEPGEPAPTPEHIVFFR